VICTDASRVVEVIKKQFCLLTSQCHGLTAEARKRIARTLEEFSDLGDGFKVAD